MFKIIIYVFYMKHVLSTDVTRSSNESNRRIVGGFVVDIRKHPFHVGYGYSCAGSIISDKWVLTAAHCRTEAWILTGSSFLQDGRIIKVKKHYRHPEYKSETLNFHFDFMLLELETTLTFDEATKPIKVGCPEDAQPGTMITVIGWGAREEDGPLSMHLREVEVPIVTNEACQRAEDNAAVKYGVQATHITDEMFCAGYSHLKKDACQGDSGGPAVTDGRLVGVVSYGYGCGAVGFYGVYSNVTHVRVWIENITGLCLNGEQEEQFPETND